MFGILNGFWGFLCLGSVFRWILKKKLVNFDFFCGKIDVEVWSVWYRLIISFDVYERIELGDEVFIANA